MASHPVKKCQICLRQDSRWLSWSADGDEFLFVCGEERCLEEAQAMLALRQGCRNNDMAVFNGVAATCPSCHAYPCRLGFTTGAHHAYKTVACPQGHLFTVEQFEFFAAKNHGLC